MRDCGAARRVGTGLGDGLASLGLDLTPVKTKAVYCKGANRCVGYQLATVDFVGRTCRAHGVLGRWGLFANFSLAMNTQTMKTKGLQISAWHLHRRRGMDLSVMARDIAPQVLGWTGFCGVFYRSELYSLLEQYRAVIW